MSASKRCLSYLLASAALCAPVIAAADTAYIPNDGSPGSGPSTVSVINTASNTVIKTIGVGTRPRTVAAVAQTKMVYITNQGDASDGFGTGSVSVINGASNTVVATVPVVGPFGIAATAQRVFVASEDTNLITAISTSSNTVVGSVLIPGGIPAAGVGAEPLGVAIAPAGTRVYTANFIDQSVSVIDANSLAIVARIPLPDQPQAIAINNAGTRVYTANLNSITAIDATTNTILTTITANGSNGISFPQGIAVNPAGTVVYATNSTGGSVTVLSGGTNTVIGLIQIGGGPQGVSFTGDGRRAYVADDGSNLVRAIDVATGTLIANVPVGIEPISVGSFMLPRCPRLADFNGDGRSDFAVYRQPTGQWFNLAAGNAVFGVANQHDLPVAEDYDGDCKADLAYWDPSTGNWNIRLSSTGQTLAPQQFGAASLGDIPTPGDYNGDGKADLAVFRQSTGQWFVNGVISTVFGVANEHDVPVAADYDGDGKTDLAYWAPNTATWHVTLSSTGAAITPVGFGSLAAGDIPVPGDYNGDGKADFAVYRQPTGQWFVSGITSAVFGVAGENDIPVPGDYDGDGKTDLAYWAPNTGTWHVLLSSTGSPASPTQFGSSAAGDIPLSAPPAYIRAHF